mgnify:CR=1 FL=1
MLFRSAYHGQHPEGVTSLVGSDPPALPQPDPAGTGAPWVERDVLVAPYNDLAATEQILTDHAADLAAVIVEPLHRCITPVDGFLQGLREATAKRGIVLVFDEVVTGFRLALGGAQEYYGVSPDLVAYGKGLGGGFPIGAFGGRADIMEAVNEQRLPGPNYAWSASTTGGNPVSAAAALATIDLFSEPGVYDRLHAMGRLLRERLGRRAWPSGRDGAGARRRAAGAVGIPRSPGALPPRLARRRPPARPRRDAGNAAAGRVPQPDGHQALPLPGAR